MSFLNYIAFPMAADRVAYYSALHGGKYTKLFDTGTNRMVLDVLPGNYTTRLRARGPDDVIEGASQEGGPTAGVVIQTPEQRYEATIKIEVGMIVVGTVINELRQNAINDETGLITVHDGTVVDIEDVPQGYTVRRWWLKKPVIPMDPRVNMGGSIQHRAYGGYELDFTAFGNGE